jgi:3-hydroxy acid dehydrogenase/malonic semialdehyde reductase
MKKTALVTGATSGIGYATATILARNGFNVIATGRRSDRLHQLKEKLSNQTEAEIYPLVFDVRDHDAVVQALDSLPEAWQQIDVLVNNAGGAAGLDLFHEANLEDWETMIDANVKGLLYVSREVAGGMVKRNSGHIINIGSISGREVYEKGSVYCSTKFAVDAITRGMRIDLLRHNIKVTNIEPGLVETEFSLVRFKGDKEKAGKVYEGLTPLYAEDIAEAILFAVTRPDHVNINDMLIMPTAQASTAYMKRDA